MKHVYQTKITKHGGRTADRKRCFYYRVWLWKPANNVQKTAFWSVVSERPTLKEANELAIKAIEDAEGKGASRE